MTPAGVAAAAGRGVGVGVLDTGLAASGDLAGRVVASADLSGEWSFTDSYGHGTFMAGLIAGSGQAGGPAGVAPGADLVDLKVAGADGATTLGQVLAALQLADAARDRFKLDLHRPAADGPQPRGRRGRRGRRARPGRRHPAAGDQGPAGRRPAVPLLLALTLRGPVVHNPRVDRSGGERGATAVAYAIMLAILGLLLVAGIMVLSGSVETALNDGAECVSNPSDCGGSGGGNGNGGGNGGGTTTVTTGPAPTTTTGPSPTTTTTGS